MSTRFPALLYTHSPTSGHFRPINQESPKESVSKKPGGGLLDSTVIESTTQNNASTTIDGSHSDGSPDSTTLRLLTWNIWFENLFKKQRTSALVGTIKSLDPLPDICCFQECTAGFELQLRKDDWWRETWAMTQCAEQFQVTGFHYGTMVFVRRELIEKMGFEAKAWFEPFKVTQTGRGLLVVELTPPKSKNPFLIATSHMDYTPQIRATQFASAISALSVTPTSVFCGDTNIDTYPELEPLLSAGYVDSWLETHPDFAGAPNLREVGVTFGTAGLRGESSPNDDGPPRRLDYLMAKGMKVKKCELVGSEQIPKEEWATSEDEEELNLEVYVSDHLGVLVDVELA